MAEEKEEVVDKKEEKKAAKEERAAKKADKKKKAASDLDMDEETTLGGKIAVFFVTLIIILIWLAIFALLIKWDVGGFGSTVLGPILKDVPYVNRILPDSVTEELSTEDSVYAFSSMDEAVDRIKQLEIELAEAQNASNSDASYIAQLESQAAELAMYRQQEASFQEMRQRFYEEVVFSDSAPDIDEYRKYYESIYPANAEVIYRQVMEQTAMTEAMEDYVKAYSSMDPKDAAAIFDTMTDEFRLVADILKQMDAKSRGDILSEMNAANAARLTEIMEP